MSSSVLVAVPNTGYIHKHTAFALLKLIRDSRVTVIMPTHSPIENNRNLIIRDFLRGEFSHLLMFDADNPPSRNPLDLIEFDKDVMILPTPQWHLTAEDGALGKFPIYWNCMDEDLEEDGWKEHSPQSGLQEIDAGGSGCMLISRRVLEQLKHPFERTWDQDGVCVYGSDFYFCKKARAHGFTVWCHYDYPCLHFKEVELTEVVTVLNARDISHIIVAER